MRNIFKRIKKSKKTQKMISHDDQLKYRLAGLYLKDDINLKPIKDQIQENTNKIDQQENTINDHENKININTNKINDYKNIIDNNTNNINNHDNKINTNINNINSNLSKINDNKNNINNMNVKLTKVVNDLANSNLASYKGLYNNNTSYKLGDLVSDNNTNNVYLSIINNNNNPLNDQNSWKIITFTIDTSNFLTNSDLDPLNIKISTNTNNINNIENRINNIINWSSIYDTTGTIKNSWNEFVNTLQFNEISISSSKTININKYDRYHVISYISLSYQDENNVIDCLDA